MFGFLKKNKRKKVHFLHIGKTGGTAVKYVLKQYPKTEEFVIHCHNHKTTLKDIPKGEFVIFCFRDPISRFISGFYSRKRKGQPRIYVEWSDLQRKVFESFETPNDLANAYMDGESVFHDLSVQALTEVRHFEHYSHWLGNMEYFKSRLDDILFVGHQESLNKDFIKLKECLGLPEKAALPTNDIVAHINPKNVDKRISEEGLVALADWYSEDYDLISFAKNIHRM